jgi:LysR family transcriptional regulator, glycine cleavage system transcriptional activator
MPRLCPPTHELIAFVAAARHESITAAAEELSLTQGAISKSVRSLEGMLGIQLFERFKQRIVLTASGRRYLNQVIPLLAALEQATLQLRTYVPQGNEVLLATVPTFGSNWLIPRMTNFGSVHPSISVNFVQLIGDEISLRGNQEMPELFIKYGEGIWPGLISEYLIGNEIVTLLPRALSNVQEPSDLRDLPLLHHTSVPHAWHDWNESISVFATESTYIGKRFDQYSMLIEAVRAGLGIALVPRCLVQQEIERGEFRTPFSTIMQGWNGYYLCRPELKPLSEPAKLVFDWIRAQAQLTS